DGREPTHAGTGQFRSEVSQPARGNHHTHAIRPHRRPQRAYAGRCGENAGSDERADSPDRAEGPAKVTRPGVRRRVAVLYPVGIESITFASQEAERLGLLAA